MAKGGKSSGRGGSSAKQSADVKRMFIEQGLNSNIAGVRKKAEQGTGNYSFKNATSIGENDVEKMKSVQVIERKIDGGEYTLLVGLIGRDENTKAVCFGAESSNHTIKKAVAQRKESSEKKLKQMEENKIKVAGMDKHYTTTYENWRKRNKRKFENWYNGR